MTESLLRPARSPVARLPNEVLCECFSIVALLEPTPKSWEHIESMTRGRLRSQASPVVDPLREMAWIRLGHVCRSWRAVLLGMPVLWARIAFTYPYPMAFSTLMDRAANAPVDVVLSWKKASDPKQEAALDCLSRARSLTLHSETDPELLELIPRKPMPSLYHLDLKLDYDPLHRTRSPNGSFEEDEEQLTIREPFKSYSLCIDAPNLRSASLSLQKSTERSGRNVVPALLFTFPALRRLSVCICDDSTDISDLTWLVNLLRKAPLIEDLTLTLQLPHRTPDWEALFKISFPRLEFLKRLRLEDRAGTRLDTFMRHICPSVPLVSLAASFDASEVAFGPEHEDITAKALEFVRGINRHSPISRGDDRALTISTKRDGIAFFSGPTLGDPMAYRRRDFCAVRLEGGVEIGVAAVYSGDLEHSYLNELVQGVQGAEEIGQLYLELASKSGCWLGYIRQKLLLRMTAVRTLYFTEPLHSMNDQTILDLLMGPQDSAILFPALETLIVWLEGEPESCYTSPRVITGTYADWWRELTSMLERRYAKGVPVKALCLRGGWQSDDILKGLFDALGEKTDSPSSMNCVQTSSFKLQCQPEGADSVRAARHGARPIVRMPNEVLCEFFCIVALLEPVPNGRKELGLTWIRLGHVCSSWRAILLRMADLWGRIAFTHPYPKAFATILDRSGKAPVDITLLRKTSKQVVQDAALACLPRARSLVIDSPVEPDLITFFSDQSLPSLHFLVANFEYYPHLSSGNVVETAEDVSLRINAPNLYTASLTIVRYPFKLKQSQLSLPGFCPTLDFTFPNLRMLDLRVLDNTADIGDTGWFLALLRTAPLLEHLILEVYGKHSRPNWDAMFKHVPVRLQHLKVLRLDDHFDHNLASLLTHIRPDTPLLKLTTVFDSTSRAVGSDEECVRAGKFVRGFRSELVRPTDRALVIMAHPTRPLDISFLCSPALAGEPEAVFDLREGGLGHNIPAYVKLRVKVQHQDLQRELPWFTELVDGLRSLGNIEQLFLYLNARKYARWLYLMQEKVFPGMTAVRTLYVTEILTSKGPVKRVNSLFESNPGTSDLLFPVLETLIIWLEEGMESPRARPKIILWRWEGWWEGLASMLERRREAGIPIKSLRLLGGWGSDYSRRSMQDLETEMLARLRDVVPDVTDERVVLRRRRRD
ncbi:hypothetical protein PENSPDRAFT_735338 [Peniophora sp. CONT]|nr:hypothetical protein PENSPDRAFT_735338 [Peniophora sp. CONT]